MPPSRYACKRCGGSGLVTSKPLSLACIVLAAAWCIAAYLIAQSNLDEPGGFRLSGRGTRLAIFIIVGPPIGLIWLAFGPVFKRGCPECSD